MLIRVCKRLGEVFLACVLLLAAAVAMVFLDWIIADEFFVGSAVPSEAYVYVSAVYIVPALLLMSVFGWITWRVWTGRARCNWRFVAGVYLLCMVCWHGFFGLPALLRFPGWFALLGKVCYGVIVLGPVVWLCLPRRSYVAQTVLDAPQFEPCRPDLQDLAAFSGK